METIKVKAPVLKNLTVLGNIELPDYGSMTSSISVSTVDVDTNSHFSKFQDIIHLPFENVEKVRQHEFIKGVLGVKRNHVSEEFIEDNWKNFQKFKSKYIPQTMKDYKHILFLKNEKHNSKQN